MTTPPPVTTTRVVTLSGAIVTQTVTSTPTPYANPDAINQLPQRKESNNAGVIAGATVGGVLGLVALLGLIFFLFRRRRNDRDSTHTRMTRNASVLSKAGLLSSAPPHDTEKNFDEQAYSQPPANRASLLHNADDIGPIATPAGVYDGGSQRSRRDSRPLVYDQRLNPHALMQNYDFNGSHASVNTMQDQHDYSRPLGIANPDLERDD